jgi:hypothetical protein
LREEPRWIVSDETPATDRHLRVVRGEPTPEELAALTAVVSAAGAGSDDADAEPPRQGRWNDPAGTHRQPWRHGPGGWRAALR